MDGKGEKNGRVNEPMWWNPRLHDVPHLSVLRNTPGGDSFLQILPLGLSPLSSLQAKNFHTHHRVHRSARKCEGVITSFEYRIPKRDMQCSMISHVVRSRFLLVACPSHHHRDVNTPLFRIPGRASNVSTPTRSPIARRHVALRSLLVFNTPLPYTVIIQVAYRSKLKSYTRSSTLTFPVSSLPLMLTRSRSLSGRR